MSEAKEIEILLNLKEKGAITEEEFDAKKREILSPNKPEKKTSLFTKVAGSVFGLFVVSSLVVGMNDTISSVAPDCSSSLAVEGLTDAFDNSQFARAMNLSTIEISDTSLIEYNEENNIRKCSGSITLNNAKTYAIDFKIEGLENGEFYITSEGIDYNPLLELIENLG